MDSLVDSLINTSLKWKDVTERGLFAVTVGDINGVNHSINNGGHLEDMLTCAIEHNKIEIVNLLLENGATVFPDDVRLATKISPEMYYLVAGHPGLLQFGLYANAQQIKVRKLS